VGHRIYCTSCVLYCVHRVCCTVYIACAVLCTSCVLYCVHRVCCTVYIACAVLCTSRVLYCVHRVCCTVCIACDVLCTLYCTVYCTVYCRPATYQFLHEVVRHRVSQHGVIVLRVDRQCLNEQLLCLAVVPAVGGVQHSRIQEQRAENGEHGRQKVVIV
jgi:hypothetical protein